MYLIYKTTNKIDGKFYVGIHKTSNINDSYLGSGKYLKLAIKKHGKENFEREILFIFENKKEAFEKEKEIVNEEFLKGNVYNFKSGGEGGWDHIIEMKKDKSFHEKLKKNVSVGVRKTFEKGRKGWSGVTVNGMLGKNHSIESKNKISKNNAAKLSVEEIKKRKEDYLKIEKKRGWKKDLSDKWEISHTSVDRFIKKHFG